MQFYHSVNSIEHYLKFICGYIKDEDFVVVSRVDFFSQATEGASPNSLSHIWMSFQKM